jgi:hypothetical protein
MLIAAWLVTSRASAYDEYFTEQTLRMDYFHSGTAREEHISLDGVRLEGPWPGSRTQLLDRTNLGKYLFEIVDAGSNQSIYSRGFASIYGEWETTGEAAAGMWKTFHESVRFPEPRRPFQLVIKKRKSDGTFSEIYSTRIDPASRFVNRSTLPPNGTGWSVLESGDPQFKVDILILGDGYAAGEADKFHADVQRLVGVLFETEPFKSRKKDFNVRAVDVVSAESGISNPRKGVWRTSPLGLSFNAFDSDRYVLTYQNQTLREIAAQWPYDALIIAFNDRKYGGGGIFNLWATVSSGTGPSGYVFVHEFGHSFAGLGDEYYTSSTAYEEFVPPGVEPWEPNITALLDPAELKWKHLMDIGTPLPTPWNKDRYDQYDLSMQAKRTQLVERKASDEEYEEIFREVKKATTPMLNSEKYFGKVGAFEGAGYRSRGLFRPQLDCIMFTRNEVPFCKVCAEAIHKVIDLYTH